MVKNQVSVEKKDGYYKKSYLTQKKDDTHTYIHAHARAPTHTHNIYDKEYSIL